MPEHSLEDCIFTLENVYQEWLKDYVGDGAEGRHQAKLAVERLRDGLAYLEQYRVAREFTNLDKMNSFARRLEALEKNAAEQ